MQAFNHVTFGALLATTLPEPLALPLAFGSHFLLDSFPHYGEDELAPRGSRPYLVRIIIDALLSVALMLYFISRVPVAAPAIIVCSLLAILPDLLWPTAYFVRQTSNLWKFFKFHKLIQRESRLGIYYEFGYFAIFFVGLILLTKK